MIDETAAFSAAVIDDFVAEHRAGRTPNPCVRCNEQIKFGPLLAFADAVGAGALATGHYARLAPGQGGGVALGRARDADKDQSYFLFGLRPEILARVRFPLGELTKDEVRALARRFALPNADKPESQEICFIPDGDHVGFLEARGGAGPGGVIVDDASGARLGAHAGTHRFTIGQRRGLPAGSGRRFVLRIDATTGEVRVGPRERLGRDRLRVADVRWLDPAAAGDRLRCAVQIRHHAAAAPAWIAPAGDGSTLVELDEPALGVAPGQAAVFYDGDDGSWAAGGSTAANGPSTDRRDRRHHRLGAGVAIALADGVDRGLELALVEEDAVAAPAVVDVDGAQHHLGEAAGAGGAGRLRLRRDGRRAGQAGEQTPQAGQLGLGQLGGAADLAAVEPEAAALRAEIDLQSLEHRLVQDGVALHAADVGCVRHGRDTSRPMGGTEQSTEAGLPELEARLGHVFRDRALSETAFTHNSWLNEAAAPGRTDNERLEFLGDAVLALVVSDLLMKRFPTSAEGELEGARRRRQRGGAGAHGATFELGHWIFLGRGEEHRRAGAAVDPGRRARGAHGGHLPRRRARRREAVAERLFQTELADVETQARLDYKSRLQERSQALWQASRSYHVVAESGPDHDKRFAVTMSLAGRECARASGRSKKEAEQSAAAAALVILEREAKPEPGGEQP